MPGKRGRGRPAAVINAELVDNAAAIGCTVEEIAALIGIGRQTLHARIADDADLAEAIERGRDKGKATLRRLQWQKANKGNATMLIWLGKQMLGQRDHFEHSGIIDTGIGALLAAIDGTTRKLPK